MALTESHEEFFKKWLHNKEVTMAYLNSVLEDVKAEDKETHKLLLIAIRNVVIAQGGMSRLAEKARLSRESLYKTLSARGNPHLDTLMTIFKTLGFEFRLAAIEQKKSVKRAKVAKKCQGLGF